MVKLSNRIQSLALGAAVLATLGIPAAIAQSDNAAAPNDGAKAEKQHHGKHGGMKQRCGGMKELNLSEDQKSKMKSLNETFKSENAAIISSLQAKHKQLKELGRGEENKAQRQQIFQSLKQERETLHTKRMALMQQVLTPAQMSQFQATREKCKAEFQQKMQERKAKRQNGDAAPKN